MIASNVIKFNVKIYTFLPISFVCFVWIPEQRAITYLYSIKWFVFITETECAYCVLTN